MQAQQFDLMDVTDTFGLTLGDALAVAKEKAFSPNDEKEARQLTPAETAQWLGIKPASLRKLHYEGKLPEVRSTPQEPEKRGENRRYTLEDLWEARMTLARTDKSLHKYLPGRHFVDGDQLVLDGSRKLQIISFATFKGGSGKTTSCCSTAQYLALSGYRVLVIDADPQASVTTLLGKSPEVDFLTTGTLYDAIRFSDPETGESPVPLEEVIQGTYFHNIDLVPGGLRMAEFETATPAGMEITGQNDAVLRISNAISSVADRYDVVLIDCPPQLGFTTLAALTASTTIIVPVIPVMIDVVSVQQFLTKATESFRRLGQFRPQIDNFKFLITRHDTQDAAQNDMVVWLRYHLKNAVMQAEFQKSAAVSDAALSRSTIYDMYKGDMNRRTHQRLTEIVNRIGDEVAAMLQDVWSQTNE